MRKGGGKPKGNGFENKIAKELSMWITKGERHDVFDRNPSSGAKATMHKKTGNLYANQTGDIVSLDDAGYSLMKDFVIECKFYKDINLMGMLWNTKGGIPGWWKKVKIEAFDIDKSPILIMKQNNKSILIGFNEWGIKKLQLEKHVSVVFPEEQLHLIQFNVFLNHANPDILLRIIPKGPIKRAILKK